MFIKLLFHRLWRRADAIKSNLILLLIQLLPFHFSMDFLPYSLVGSFCSFFCCHFSLSPLQWLAEGGGNIVASADKLLSWVVSDGR